MNYNADERAYLWLCACTKTEYRERVALLRKAHPCELLESAERYFAEGQASDGRAVREREADEFCRQLEKKGFFAVTLLSDDYPEALKHISLPPLVLYGAGNRTLLSKRKFCIVGSRNTPPWSMKAGRAVSEEITKHFVIVTGLAEGGDECAISGALESGNLISVLPCGLDECYPAAHASIKENIRKSGLLLSELLPGDKAKKYSFHARNRILAGLSEGVLVLSAAKKSGALITANCALDFGRDVFAFPYNLGYLQGEGCNELIKRGAYLATGAEDVLSVYGISCQGKRSIALTEEEARVYEVLRENGELHAVAIAEQCGMKAFEATAVLSALEIKGVVAKSGGNRYSAV